MGRVTLEEFVFSDGTVLPKKTTITVNIQSRHNDDSVYPNARAFDAFRFARNPHNGNDGRMLVTPTLDFHGLDTGAQGGEHSDGSFSYLHSKL